MNHCLFINNNEHLFRRVNCFFVYINFAGLYNVHFEAKKVCYCQWIIIKIVTSLKKCIEVNIRVVRKCNEV